MEINNRLDIEKYTIALYREKFFEPITIGSGILIRFLDNYYLVSADHIFDMEEERLKIKNDPEEEGIRHDDMEGIMAKGINENEIVYFYINDSYKGLAFTTKYGENKLNEATEWGVCKLSEEMVQYFMNAGKDFYIINDVVCPEIKSDTTIIISGYPRYAQNKNQEEYRSFKCEGLIDNIQSDNGLFRVYFNNQEVYNYEKERQVKLPPKGMNGISGGGFWYEKDNTFIPIGIFLMQDPNEKYIEGYRLDLILKEIIDSRMH